MLKNRGRSGSWSLDFGLPNTGRSRRSFYGPSSPSSSQENESGSESSSYVSSPSLSPESTPRALPPALVLQQQNEILGSLCRNQRLCSSILEDDIGDDALQVLIKVLTEARTLLPLVRDQVQTEFLTNAEEKDAILRGNCVATRIMSVYSHRVGTHWIRNCLKGTIKKVLHEEQAWLTDVDKVPSSVAAEEREAKVLEGQTRLLAVATYFLRKLTKHIQSCPREIRCMAFFVWIQARAFCPDRSSVLLGGFIFLRLLNPALLSPESVSKLLPEGFKSNATFKQNCVTLCRLLQHLSNGKSFSGQLKENLNQWLQQNAEPLESLLLDLATDPSVSEGARPFAELSRMPESDQLQSLRAQMTDAEWNTLHICLWKSKTHVMVKSKLAPVLGVAGPENPRESASMPSSPYRSRSGTRFRGEGEDVSIYQDGKVRMRPSRHGSVGGGGLFANNSQPNLREPMAVSPPAAAVVSQLDRPRTASVGSGVFGSRARMSRSGSVSASSSPTVGSPGPVRASSEPDINDDGGVASPEQVFYALLSTLPLPEEIRKDQFVSSIQALQRARLSEEGLLPEGRRASIRLGAYQVELLVKLAISMRQPEFGLKVDSFTASYCAEWMNTWLGVDQAKDVDHILSLMVRSGLLYEKGSKAGKGFVLDNERIAEMDRLLSK